MPVALDVEVDLGSLGNLSDAGRGRAISRGLVAIGTRVQGISRLKYLSGPRPTLLARRTGTLARSITVDTSGLPNFVDVGSPEIYAPIHEFGATIRALGSKPLVFGFGANGGPPLRSAREVRIPARPYLAPALEDARDEMADLMSAEIERELNV